MNLLLLLTALLTSLTGMVGGARAAAAPMSVVRADAVAERAVASITAARVAQRPQQDAPRLLLAVAPPPSQALAAAARPVPERRRE